VCAGKRISQKLLRNCVKFLSIIHDVLKIAPMEYIKQSSDEIDIRGPESKYDSRKINSYPSKVGIAAPFSTFFRRFRCCAGVGLCLCLPERKLSGDSRYWALLSSNSTWPCVWLSLWLSLYGGDDPVLPRKHHTCDLECIASNSCIQCLW